MSQKSSDMKSLLVKGKWLPEEQYLLEIREENTHVNLGFLRPLGANNSKQSTVFGLLASRWCT